MKDLSYLSEKLQVLFQHFIRFGEITIIEKDLADPIPETKVRIDVEFKPATVADLLRLRGWESDRHIRTMQKKLENGYLCLIALDKDRIAGHCFVTSSKELELITGMVVVPGPNEVYMTDLYVAKDYRSLSKKVREHLESGEQSGERLSKKEYGRGHSIGMALMNEFFRSLREQKKRKVYAAVLRDNRIALNVAARVNFSSPLTSFKFVKIPALLNSSAVVRLGIELSRFIKIVGIPFILQTHPWPAPRN